LLAAALLDRRDLFRPSSSADYLNKPEFKLNGRKNRNRRHEVLESPPLHALVAPQKKPARTRGEEVPRGGRNRNR
jgi:hypothetical protein